MTHRQKMWAWIAFGLIGLVDFAIRDDISKIWTQPIANSVPVVFLLSVLALAIGEEAADEAETTKGD